MQKEIKNHNIIMMINIIYDTNKRKLIELIEQLTFNFLRRFIEM